MKSALIAAAFLLLAAAGAWFLISRSEQAPVAPPPAATQAQVPVPPREVPALPIAVSATAPRGAAFSGRVLAASDGNPVTGARVEVDGSEAESTTAADGSFRVEGLSPGRRAVRILPVGHAPAEVEVELAEGKETVRDVFVRAGAVVEGRVLFEGKPMPGAVVSIADGMRSCTTGKDGSFVLQGLPPGYETLFVEAAGFEEHPVDLDVPPGVAEVHLDVELRRAWVVRGTVLDGDRPVEGARVVANLSHLRSDPRGTASNAARSAADGTFVLSEVEDAEHGVLFAWREGVGFGVSERVETHFGSTLESVAVRILPMVQVAISVSDAAGAPLSGIPVVATRKSVGKSDEGRIPLRPGIREAAVATDAEGRCVLRLQPGEWRVEASREGSFTAEEEVVILRGPGRMGCRLTLREGGDIRGRVLGPDGRPLASARVWVLGLSDESVTEMETDAEGAFLFRSRPDLEHRLRAEKEGFVATTIEGVDPTGAPVEVTLPRGSRIRGTVVLADGKTPARASTVRLFFRETEEGKPWHGGMWPFRQLEVNGTDGRFEFPDIEAGTIAAEAECGDLQSPRVEGIRTAPGKDPPEVRLVLKRGAVLKGTVRDSKGTPLPGAVVDLEFAPPGFGGVYFGADRRSTADGEGRYEFRVVPAGPYRLRATREGFLPASSSVDLPAGVESSTDFTLSRGGMMRVECFGEDGGALDGFAVDFLDDAGERREVSVLYDDGAAVVVCVYAEEKAAQAWLAAGAYRARVILDGFKSEEFQFTIREGDTTNQRVVLTRK